MADGTFPVSLLADAFANMESQNLLVARFSLNPADMARLRKAMGDGFGSDRGKATFWNAVAEEDPNIPEGSIKMWPMDPRRGVVPEETVRSYERVKRICASTWSLAAPPSLEKKPD